MVDAWLENPFEPIAWFFGGWVVVVAVANSVNLAWRSLPMNRFHALTDEARHLSSMFKTRLDKVNGEWTAIDPELRERILTFKSRLEDLRVPVPSLDHFEPIEWYLWLPQLASWADTKNLYEAKLDRDV